MRRNIIPITLVALAALGCAKKAANLDAARDEIRTADANWLKATKDRDMDTFLSFISEKGSILPPNQPIVTGADALREWASNMMQSPGFAITWQPMSVDVASSGDLGYSIGAYDMNMQGPTGTMVDDQGKYVTIWKKYPDGNWRVIAETFNSNAPATAMLSADSTGSVSAGSMMN